MTLEPESGLTWRKSSFSDAQGACVQVAWPTSLVAVRDSKHTIGPTLTFPRTMWSALTTSLRA